MKVKSCVDIALHVPRLIILAFVVPKLAHINSYLSWILLIMSEYIFARNSLVDNCIYLIASCLVKL